MKEYLKMSGYFIGSVTINADGQICDDKHFRGSTDIAEDYYRPICHAINSHDELVAEVERLHGIIDRVISTANEMALMSPTTQWGDGYKECALTTARALEDLLK